MRYTIFLMLLFAVKSPAQTGVEGRWQTPNQSVVEVARCGTAVCAKILAIGPTAPSHLDAKNPDKSLRNRSLCNLQIGSSFHLTDANHAEDGQLYDPESGHTYRGTMTTEGDRLKLRGYIGIKLFGRTETWTRLSANAATAPCR